MPKKHPAAGGAPAAKNDGVLCHDNLVGHCPKGKQCLYSHHVTPARRKDLPCSRAPHCLMHTNPPALVPDAPVPPCLGAAAPAAPPPTAAQSSGGLPQAAAAPAAPTAPAAAAAPASPCPAPGGAAAEGGGDAAAPLQWRWEWEQSAKGDAKGDAKGKVWSPYDDATQAKLEARYLAGVAMWEAESRGQTYRYDFLGMKQTNKATSMARRMRRVPCSPTEAEQGEHAVPCGRWQTQQADGHPGVAFYKRIGDPPQWDIPNGKEVQVTGYDGEFAAITLKERSGFVKRRNLQEIPPPKETLADLWHSAAERERREAERAREERERREAERARLERERREADRAREEQERREAERAREEALARERREREERERREREERERREREERERREREEQVRQRAELLHRERQERGCVAHGQGAEQRFLLECDSLQRRHYLCNEEDDARCAARHAERDQREEAVLREALRVSAQDAGAAPAPSRPCRAGAESGPLGPAELRRLAEILCRAEPPSEFELDAAARVAGSSCIDSVAAVLLQWSTEVDSVRCRLCGGDEFVDVPPSEVESVVRPVVVQGLSEAGGADPEALLARCGEALRAHLQRQLHNDEAAERGDAESAERLQRANAEAHFGVAARAIRAREAEKAARKAAKHRDMCCASGRMWRLHGKRISDGAGCFGKVYPASLVTDGTAGPPDYCLKLIDETAVCHGTGWDREYCRQRFQREVGLLRRARHPTVVEFYDDAVIDGRYLVMVMEYLKGGTLNEVFTVSFPSSPVPSRISRRLFAQLAVALRHLDELQIVHRDLKPKNIVLSRAISPGARDCEGVVLKLIDFGIAAELDMGSIQDTRLPPAVGALGWMAPETVDGLHRDGRTDVWASGCILFQCAVGRVPFTGAVVAQLYDRIRAGERRKEMPAVPEGEDPADWALQWELVGQLLQVDMHCRPAAAAVCTHPWVASEVAAVTAPGGGGAGGGGGAAPPS